MARAALSGRLTWRTATLVDSRWETGTARTLVLRVPGWPGHLAGQHVDVRLTAEDGYTARRSYSVAAPANGELVELTVQRVDDGEVSPYLTDVLPVDARIELRGPVGGWFVWRPANPRPVLLVAGGSGIVPLMAMVRARGQAGDRTPFRLIYSVRTPEQVYYAQELREARRAGLDVALVYTRTAAEGTRRPPGRITADDLARDGWPAEFQPDCYVCGPTGFVEVVADLLTGLGHDPASIRTERFGPTGG